MNGADHRDWLASNHVFEDIALYRNLANFNLTGAGEPERLLAARISANLFPVLASRRQSAAASRRTKTRSATSRSCC